MPSHPLHYTFGRNEIFMRLNEWWQRVSYCSGQTVILPLQYCCVNTTNCYLWTEHEKRNAHKSHIRQCSYCASKNRSTCHDSVVSSLWIYCKRSHCPVCAVQDHAHALIFLIFYDNNRFSRCLSARLSVELCVLKCLPTVHCSLSLMPFLLLIHSLILI